jgi:hypothetical protein
MFVGLNASEDKWVKKLNSMISEKYHQRFPNKRADSEMERRLARWVIRMRMDYRNKEARMTEDRIIQLSSLPGWIWNE